MIACRAGLLIVLAACTLSGRALELVGSDVGPNSSGCLVVTHQGFDGYAEYLDPIDQVVARAGSWLGRHSRYLLLAPDDTQDWHDYRIRIVGLDGVPAASDQVTLDDCPANLDPRFASALFAAQNLRLARYRGEQVSSDEIAQLYDRALELADAQPPEWQALLYFETAAHLRAISQHDQALSFYSEAAEQFGIAGDQARQAAAINSRGLAHWRSGRTDSALADFQTAITLRQQTGDLFGLAVSDNNHGLVLMETGQLDSAELALERALSHFQGTLDLRRPVAVEQIDQSLASGSTGEPKADLPAALNTLNNLALLQRDRGQVELAERYWRNYLALEARLPRAQAAAEARLNLSRLLLDQGRIDEVLDLGSLALEQQLIADRGRWAAQAYGLLAEAYEWLGDRDQAMAYLEQAIALARDDQLIRAGLLRSLAWLRQRAGDGQGASQALEQALELLSPVDQQALRVRLQADLIWLNGAMRDGQSSTSRPIDELAAVARELERLGQASAAAEARSRQAVWLAAAGQSDRALAMLDAVIEDQQSLGDVLAMIDSLDRLSRIQRDLAHQAQNATLARALREIERIHARDLPPLRRAGFLGTSRALYDRLVIALIDQGLHEQAWQVAQRARGRGLRQAQAWRDRHQQSSQIERLLDHRATLIEQHFVQVRLNREASPEIHDVQTRQALDRLDIELERTRATTRPATPTSLSSVQAGLANDQLLISYYLADKRLLAWRVNTESTELVQLGTSDGLDVGISDLISRLRHPRQALGAMTRRLDELHHRLVAPLQLEHDNPDVLIQPDGMLASVPWSLLFTEVAGHRPAVTQWLGRAPRPNRDPAESSMLLLADPGWSDSPAGLERLPDQSLLAQVLRSPAAGRLPGSRREAEAIAELARSNASARPVTLRLGQQASREYVLAGGLQGYRRVHIASHGLVDLDYPELSALLLASESGLGPAFLRPHEIAELNLSAELVVLSGCETGAGRILAGEGALSLARPFLIAGAEQVLASLWKIDDHRTAEFMQRFYQHLLIDQQPAARALARAQAWMRQQPGTSHPYYWAGFVLIES